MPQTNAASFAPIHRSNQGFLDPKATQRELAQQVVGISIPLPEAVPVQGQQRASTHRHVAALRVGDVGSKRVSSGHGKQMIPHPPVPRHAPSNRRPAQPVAFDVICFARNERREQTRQVCSVHLTVGRHDGNEVHAERDRSSTTGRDCSTHTEVDGVANQLDRPRAPKRSSARAILAPIIDDDGVVHEARDSGKCGEN